MDLVRRLADHFKVSIAFLVGEDKNAPDADTQIQLMFRQISQLKDHEKVIVQSMVESLIKNRATNSG